MTTISAGGVKSARSDLWGPLYSRRKVWLIDTGDYMIFLNIYHSYGDDDDNDDDDDDLWRPLYSWREVWLIDTGD